MLRAGVIGVGYLGRFHAQKYQKHQGVKLVGISDQNQGQGRKISEELQVPFFLSYQEMVGQVDLVSVAASTRAHYEIAKYFLENRIPVNVEKPLAATLAEAEELVQISNKTETLLTVGQIERFNPVLKRMRDILNSQDFLPYYLEFTRCGPFKERGSDVDVLHDLAIHDMDLLHWFTGKELSSLSPSPSVSGVAGKVVSKQWDWASYWVEMNEKLKAYFRISRVSPAAERTVRLFGRNRAGEDEIWLADSNQLRLECYRKSLRAGEFLQTQTISVEKTDALQSEIDAFVKSVAHQEPSLVGGQVGLEALRAVALVSESLKCPTTS